jgi:WD40 repeat protein
MIELDRTYIFLSHSFSAIALIIAIACGNYKAIAQPRSIVVGDNEQTQLTPAQIQTIARQITVRIAGKSQRGSGVIINRQENLYLVLTNAHVVNTQENYRIITSDNISYVATKRLLIPNLDLALLFFTSDRNLTVAEIESTPLNREESLYVAGWARSGGSLRQPVLQISPGNFVEIDRSLPLGYSITYNNLVRAGMSGGAILNDRGKLVGINGLVGLSRNSDRIFAAGIGIERYLDWYRRQANLPPLFKASKTLPTVSLSNNQDYRLVKTLSLTKGSANAIKLHPDNNTLIVGSSEGKIEIWQLSTGNIISSWQSNSSVNSIALNPDSKILASAGDNGIVYLWELATGKLVKSFPAHQQAITSLAFSPDGQTLASSSWDKTVKVWQTNGNLIHTLTGHEKVVNAIAISSDGKTLVSGSQDRTIRLWDLTTGKLQGILASNSLAVLSLAIGRDNNTLVNGCADGSIELWNLTTQKLIRTGQGHQDGVWSIVISEDLRTLFTSSWDKTVKVWDLNTSNLQQTLEQHQSYIISLSSNLDLTIIVSGDWQGKIQIWQRR